MLKACNSRVNPKTDVKLVRGKKLRKCMLAFSMIASMHMCEYVRVKKVISHFLLLGQAHSCFCPVFHYTAAGAEALSY